MMYVALLRGINVNGQKLVKMELLRSIFQGMEFEKVKTYIQTGNVIFWDLKKEKDILCNQIETTLKEALSFEIPVILRTLEELESIIDNNPFKNISLSENEKLHVTFLSEVPSNEAKEFINLYKDEIDEVKLQENNIYILCRKGYGKTKFSNSFLEKKLKVRGTTRNFDTLNKIVEIGRE